MLTNQESCVINGGTTTQYFKLERGARQGDPIAAYLFILALEIFFIMVKKNSSIKPLTLCESTFLYSAYADDATFGLKDENSIRALFDTMKLFSRYSDLKPNLSKCELAGIGVLKGVKRALCGLTSIDLSQTTIKILGVHFSYNKTLRDEKNFVITIKKIETLLQIWRQRELTLEGKITIFKSLAISKIVYLAYLSDVPKYVIEELQKIQNSFIWNGKRAKIKHKTLCNSYEKGGLQSVDIEVKIKALQFSWVQRLFDDNEHQWKAIPRYLLKCAFNDTIVFHPHFCPPANSLSSFPLFYQNIINTWNECSTKPLISRNILDQCIWHNAFLRIENKPFYFSSFAEANLNYVYQFFSPNGRIKDWIYFAA